jgi:hypothetical protein
MMLAAEVVANEDWSEELGDRSSEKASSLGDPLLRIALECTEIISDARGIRNGSPLIGVSDCTSIIGEENEEVLASSRASLELIFETLTPMETDASVVSGFVGVEFDLDRW